MAIVSMLYGAGGASSAEEVSYDNTTSGLEAENVQDAIDEINSNLSQKEFVVNDDLASYTQENPYICRHDGYLYIDGTQLVVILGATSASVTQAGASSNNNSVTLFVKKGMRLYRQSGSGNIKFKGIG